MVLAEVLEAKAANPYWEYVLISVEVNDCIFSG